MISEFDKDILIRVIDYLLNEIDSKDHQIQYWRKKDSQTTSETKQQRKEGISKLRIFIDAFNALSGEDKDDVEAQNLLYELVKTGEFTEKEAREYIHKAIQNGQIYERKTGFYAKA